MTDELLDIVNDRDEVIGQKYKTDIYRDRDHCFRVINAFLLNDRNQIWIPKRSATKKLFPSCLDTSVGGHVAAGESYEQAFERELAEELNMSAGHFPCKLIGKLTPAVHNVSAYMQLYIIHTNITPDYNRLDFAEAHWTGIVELIEQIKNGEPTKGDLPRLLEFLTDFLRS